MAALFKAKLNEQSVENADVSPNSSQLSGQEKQHETADVNNNQDKMTPSPATKLAGFFKKKTDVNEIKANVSATDTHISSVSQAQDRTAKADDTADEQVKSLNPGNKLASLMKARKNSQDLTNHPQETSKTPVNDTSVNQSKPAPPPAKMRVSPKLAAILRPRSYKSSLGEASGLGQFLELKMKGGMT